ncbi:MAG TPA: hypothetical protein DCZ94_04215 [Lentisphaeria bacterium]|nr:MAG: hypothetical protein A2X48_05435 [Lentisphaerae bacterium GWF2_49_21]HBC86141.1 hypothetical protein [Lentisphaeria bacterium]
MNAIVNKIIFAAAAILLALFLYSAFEIFSLRFSKGDVYPDYSTLNSDPKGCKALFEGLSEINGVGVSRLMTGSGEIAVEDETVLFKIGAPAYSVKGNSDLYDFVFKGGRAVVFFHPDSFEAGAVSPRVKSKTGKKAIDAELPDGKASRNMKKWIREWAFTLRRSRTMPLPGQKAVPEPGYMEKYSFTGFPMYSASYFEVADPGWLTVYSSKGKPVVIERRLGSGTVVLSCVPYPLSNEALRKDFSPELICWLVGEKKKVLFDEGVHGMREEKNLVWLLKKYRLEVLGANLLLVIILLLWRNMYSVALREVAGSDGGWSPVNPGCSSSSGLGNLLQKAVPKKDIVKACYDEWLRIIRYHNVNREKKKEIDAIMEKGRSSAVKAVETYNEINTVIMKKKTGSAYGKA